MGYYVKSVVPVIESNYDKFTTVEKTIADFFIHNKEKGRFFSKSSWQSDFLCRKPLWYVLLKNVDIMDIKNLFINMKIH